MELATTLPAELLTLCAPQTGGAPGLQRPSAATESDDSGAAGAFGILLQLMAGQLPAGQPLPQGGSDLPVAASGVLPAGSAPQSSLAALLAAAAPQLTTSAAPAPSAPTTATDGTVPGTAADALRAALAASQSSTDAGAVPPSLAAQPAPTSAQPLDAAAALEAALPAPVPTAESSARPRLKPTSEATSVNAARVAAALEAQRDTATDPTADVPPPLAAGDVPAANLKAAHLDEPVLAVLPTGDTTSPTSLLGHGAAHNGAGATAPGTTAAAPAAAPLPTAQAPLDTQSARWHEALASRIHTLVDHEVGEARIKLNPPELGALDIKISMQDDKTFVQMTAHSAAARDELSQSLPRLRELLSAGGLDLGGATVSGGHDERGSRQQSALSFVRQIDDLPAIDADPSLRRARGTATIDTFA